jgi:hypothetical protein
MLKVYLSINNRYFLKYSVVNALITVFLKAITGMRIKGEFSSGL